MNDPDKPQGLNPDMMTNIYRLAVVILLAGILVLQWQILGTMSAGGATTTDGLTWGDLRMAPDSLKRGIIDSTPLVRVQNGVLTIRGKVKLDDATIAKLRGEQ